MTWSLHHENGVALWEEGGLQDRGGNTQWLEGGCSDSSGILVPLKDIEILYQHVFVLIPGVGYGAAFRLKQLTVICLMLQQRCFCQLQTVSLTV